MKKIYRSPLFKEQRGISFDIFNALEKKELFNIPTGRGKTFILLDVAMRIIEEHNKPVIISVPNNYLVKDMYQKAINYFGFNDEDCEIRIGSDNYIDLEKLKKFILLENSNRLFDLKKVEKFIKKHKNKKILFDEFFDAIELKEIGADGYIRHSIALEHSHLDKTWKKLTITNHYYLLSKTIYDKNFSIKEFGVLIDEVHEIGDVAEQLLTNSFSFFEYKNILFNIRKEIEKEEDFFGKSKALKEIKLQEVRADKLLFQYSSENRAEEYISGDELSQEIIEKSVSLLDNKNHQYIAKKVLPRIEGYHKFFERINSLLSSVKNYSNGGKNLLYGVYFSPSRGYPTVRASSGNPLGKIHFSFWEEIEMFAGVSGSVTSSFSPTKNEVRYGYARLGMNKKDDKREIHFYDRIFPKENIRINVIDKDFYEGIEKDNVYSEDFDPSYSLYYKKILSLINENHKNKNTMVLCSGYKEVKYLAIQYEKSFNKDEVNIIYANTKEKPSQTLKRFKEQGGILFATKNYGIGISLEEELLEKLFILKLPYANHTTKKWQEIKAKSLGKFYKEYMNEMLITFIQNLGRIARTKEDRGDVYLLDYGYHNLPDEVKIKIMDIIKEYGEFSILSNATTTTPTPTIKKSLSSKELEEKMEALF